MLKLNSPRVEPGGHEEGCVHELEKRRRAAERAEHEARLAFHAAERRAEAVTRMSKERHELEQEVRSLREQVQALKRRCAEETGRPGETKGEEGCNHLERENERLRQANESLLNERSQLMHKHDRLRMEIRHLQSATPAKEDKQTSATDDLSSPDVNKSQKGSESERAGRAERRAKALEETLKRVRKERNKAREDCQAAEMTVEALRYEKERAESERDGALQRIADFEQRVASPALTFRHTEPAMSPSSKMQVAAEEQRDATSTPPQSSQLAKGQAMRSPPAWSIPFPGGNAQTGGEDTGGDAQRGGEDTGGDAQTGGEDTWQERPGDNGNKPSQASIELQASSTNEPSKDLGEVGIGPDYGDDDVESSRKGNPAGLLTAHQTSPWHQERQLSSDSTFREERQTESCEHRSENTSQTADEKGKTMIHDEPRTEETANGSEGSLDFLADSEAFCRMESIGFPQARHETQNDKGTTPAPQARSEAFAQSNGSVEAIRERELLGLSDNDESASALHERVKEILADAERLRSLWKEENEVKRSAQEQEEAEPARGEQFQEETLSLSQIKGVLERALSEFWQDREEVQLEMDRLKEKIATLIHAAATSNHNLKQDESEHQQSDGQSTSFQEITPDDLEATGSELDRLTRRCHDIENGLKAGSGTASAEKAVQQAGNESKGVGTEGGGGTYDPELESEVMERMASLQKAFAEADKEIKSLHEEYHQVREECNQLEARAFNAEAKLKCADRASAKERQGVEDVEATHSDHCSNARPVEVSITVEERAHPAEGEVIVPSEKLGAMHEELQNAVQERDAAQAELEQMAAAEELEQSQERLQELEGENERLRQGLAQAEDRVGSVMERLSSLQRQWEEKLRDAKNDAEQTLNERERQCEAMVRRVENVEGMAQAITDHIQRGSALRKAAAALKRYVDHVKVRLRKGEERLERVQQGQEREAFSNNLSELERQAGLLAAEVENAGPGSRNVSDVMADVENLQRSVSRFEDEIRSRIASSAPSTSSTNLRPPHPQPTPASSFDFAREAPGESSVSKELSFGLTSDTVKRGDNAEASSIPAPIHYATPGTDDTVVQ